MAIRRARHKATGRILLVSDEQFNEAEFELVEQPPADAPAEQPRRGNGRRRASAEQPEAPAGDIEVEG